MTDEEKTSNSIVSIALHTLSTSRTNHPAPN